MNKKQHLNAKNGISWICCLTIFLIQFCFRQHSKAIKWSKYKYILILILMGNSNYNCRQVTLSHTKSFNVSRNDIKIRCHSTSQSQRIWIVRTSGTIANSIFLFRNSSIDFTDTFWMLLCRLWCLSLNMTTLPCCVHSSSVMLLVKYVIKRLNIINLKWIQCSRLDKIIIIIVVVTHCATRLLFLSAYSATMTLWICSLFVHTSHVSYRKDAEEKKPKTKSEWRTLMRLLL